MSHLQRRFHFARQKRDNISTLEMLHQMSIRVVVFAIGLALINQILKHLSRQSCCNFKSTY